MSYLALFAIIRIFFDFFCEVDTAAAKNQQSGLKIVLYSIQLVKIPREKLGWPDNDPNFYFTALYSITSNKTVLIWRSPTVFPRLYKLLIFSYFQRDQTKTKFNIQRIVTITTPILFCPFPSFYDVLSWIGLKRKENWFDTSDEALTS